MQRQTRPGWGDSQRFSAISHFPNGVSFRLETSLIAVQRTDSLEKKSLSIIGTGRVAKAIATRLLPSGRRLVFGSRTPESKGWLNADNEGQIPVVSISQAVERSEICLLAIPWTAMKQTIGFIDNWDSKVIIDCSNPLNATFDGLEIGFVTSAAEQIANWARNGRVVKALNTASTELMNRPMIQGEPTCMFYCGDDQAAKLDVSLILSEIGFQPVDAGPLKSARYLEPLAMLYIDMAVRGGHGFHWGLKVLK